MRVLAIVFAVATAGCGKGVSLTGPSDSPAAPAAPIKPPFDMLDFMLGDGTAWSSNRTAHASLPTFRTGPDRWVECKFGDCRYHESMRYDSEWIYLDEDHSMLADQAWFVYTLGKWAKRRWQPGESFDVSHFSAWYQDGSCHRNIEGHEIVYRIRFEELWTDYDFGGDLGVRDAVVLTYSPDRPQYVTGHPPRYETPEWNVYARGAGRVYWGYDRPGPSSAYGKWKIDPWGNPGAAQTCVWR